MNAKMMALKRRRGISMVFIAIVLFALLGFIGMMLDYSYVYLTGHQLQNAADAAALAGAAQVATNSPSAAVTAAVNAAADNKVSGSYLTIASSDVATGSYDLSTATFTSGGTPTYAVQVTSRRTSGSPSGPINLIFAPMYGVTTSNVSRVATAMCGFGAGIIALDPTKSSSFGTNGNITVDVTGGGIQVNSSANNAVTVKGSSATIQASELKVNGGVSTSGNPQLPNTVLGAPVVADPLASLPTPTYNTNNDLGTGGAGTLVPGYYSGGISASHGTVTLDSGTYVLGPPGLQISANANLTGSGVTIYVTSVTTTDKKKGTITTYGTVNIGGGGTITLSPPTTGTYAGIVIFQDPTTPYSTGSDSVGGNGTMNISGVIYTPSVDFSGSGDSTQFATQIIADTVSLSGNSSLSVNYDGNNRVDLSEVFLVK